MGLGKHKRITIRDVASKAGVSYQTVSRVLNDRYDVASETRERILSTIKELNYRPSTAARLLNQERTLAIGVVIPYEPDYLSNDQHMLRILCGANRVATLHGYSTLLSTLLSSGDSLSAYQQFLNEHQVDGVIVASHDGILGAQLLIEHGYPVVMVGYNSSDILGVHSDDENSSYNLMQHLLALQHRRIAIINGPAGDAAMEARYRGYEHAMSDAGLSIDSSLVTTGDFTFKSGYDAVLPLIQHSDPPTAIFAFNDAMAMGAIHHLQELKYDVPRDISVAGYDDHSSAEYFNPPLTTVHQYSYNLGQRAAELLFDVLNGITPSASEMILPTHLIVRKSTRMVKSHSSLRR